MASSQVTCPLTNVNAEEDLMATHPESKKRADVDRWFYPKEIANDLQNVDIPAEKIPEILSTGWEFTRILIPHFTDYTRYIAFCRCMVIAAAVDYNGSSIDLKAGNLVYGYDLQALLRTLFEGTVYYEDMCREFRCFIYFAAMKTSNARKSNIFKQYADSLAYSPPTWFRLRDCDAIIRFVTAGAFACNAYNQTWFCESELQILAEICMTMYDSVGFYKHRAEAEIHSTFSYCGEAMRKECFRRCREILWELDIAWVNKPAHRLAINLIRNVSGPMQIMVRRHRFVEDDLTVGLPETEETIKGARQNDKAWYRLETIENQAEHFPEETVQELEKEKILFPGCIDILQASKKRCESCSYPHSYGTNNVGQFSCVQLCDRCRSEWQTYMKNLPNRAAEVFTFLQHGSDGNRCMEAS